MATALTGSLGWTGLHPFQLGGPPLIQTWSRPLAQTALPLIAHAYQSDGVTFIGTFEVLARPSIKATLANGGQEQIVLEVPTPAASTGSVWGTFVWGVGLWGGAGGVNLGHVIRLREQGGPWNGFIYSGVVEGFPDTRSAGQTTHGILLTPFGFELTRVSTQLVYRTLGMDIVQAVRDAVALTQHCHCDQTSVPVTTGIPLVSTSSGAVDFRGQKVNQVLDTCRSIAGPNWFWHCDELGRVWFQPQGSGSVYTLVAGQHYENRTSNGGDIQARINQVPAVGGVPTGGSANVQATANGASQASIGIRTLDPPVQAPGITDQATLLLLAQGILGALDVVWSRASISVLPPTGQPNERHPGRVHASQPGGATLRYFEPGKAPLPESGVGAGYAGPFIVQSVDYDGLYQTIEAGSAPVTSQSDIDNMVQRLARNISVNAMQVTAAALNLNQTLTGSFQSSPGSIDPATGNPAALWSLTQAEFSVADPAGKVRAEMGNLNANGNSPAQWGFRANDATGAPIMDSAGLMGVMQQIGFVFTVTPGSTSSGTPGVIPLMTKTFSVTRQSRIFYIIRAVGFSNVAYGNVDPYMDGVSQYAQALVFDNELPAQTVTWALSTLVASGSHTLDLRAYVSAAGTFNWLGANLDIYLQGAV